MRILLLLLFTLCASATQADALFIHENPNKSGHCYLTNSAGKKVFEGEYQTDCFAIGASQLSTDPNADEPAEGYHTLHLFIFVANLAWSSIPKARWFTTRIGLITALIMSKTECFACAMPKARLAMPMALQAAW